MLMDADADATLRITGYVRIELRDAHGALKDEREIRNLVVTAGKSWIASRMTGTPATMGWMQLGTGVTAPAPGDTTLTTPNGSAVAVTSQTANANSVAYVCTFNAGVATGSNTEAGIFNAASSGTMLAHTTFTTIVKGASDTMTVTWTITIA
jgi:hypothetical protein